MKIICKGTDEEGVFSPKDEFENPWEGEEKIGL